MHIIPPAISIHRKKVRKGILAAIILLMIFTLLNPLAASACTLWGSAGSANQRPSTLLAKNRDESPTQKDIVQLYKNPKGYDYLAMYAIENGRNIGVRSGINRHGLSVGSATAGSVEQNKIFLNHLPTTRRRFVSLNHYILSNFKTVDEVIAQKELLSEQLPCILIIGDREKVAVIEIGLEGAVSIHQENDGILYRTNHFIDRELLKYNARMSSNSTTRLSRIKELMEQNIGKLNMKTYVDFSIDRNNGPDDSLWRTGSQPWQFRTLAVWISEIPENADPIVYVKIANPGEPESEHTVVLNNDFWNQPDFLIQ